MNAHTDSRVFGLVSAAIAIGGAGATGAFVSVAPGGAAAPTITFPRRGTSATPPALMMAGGNTPWG
jgi:hypothetical protein